MYKCLQCDEYFDLPQWFGEGEEEVRICPYCGGIEIVFLDEDYGRE